MGHKIADPGECWKAEFHVLAETWIKAGVIFPFATKMVKTGTKKVRRDDGGKTAAITDVGLQITGASVHF